MKTNEILVVEPTLQWITCCTVTVLFTLLMFAHLSYGADFSARHLGDYGNVTVMEVSGGFDSENADGSLNTMPRQVIAREFFRLHKDEYDFVTIFSNFDYQRPPNAVAFYTPVKNDTKGIGQKIIDDTQAYGSNGKLQGTIDMWNLLKLVTDPLDPMFNSTVDTLVHETQHRWGAYVRFMDWNGSVSNALLGLQASHWSFLFDSGGSTHLGNKWKINGDGTFTSTTARKYYSPQDLYLMGMIDKSRVPPTLLIDNAAIDPARMPEVGDTISGIARFVSVDDIIAVEGERIPTARDSQKQFKTAFIYVVSPGTFKPEDLYGVENLRNAYLTRFSILTDGKGLVQVTSTPRDDLATNTGVRPPSSTPRTLPPNIDSGVTWLLNRQQADGNWTDCPLTTERDTSEAVTTLQNFPISAQSFQAGLAWLGSNSAANTDYLARRIESVVQTAGDSSSLVQELLARRNRDGGWGSNRNFISSATDTALALKALAVAGNSDSSVTGPAIAYLQGTQNADGGWSGDDAFSSIQPTAAVVTAFNSYRKTADLDAHLTRAVAFLAARQNPDGGFGNSPSTVYDSALAVIALQAAGADKSQAARGVSYLLGQQSEDGAWADSPYQTALAVRAVWAATVDPDLSIKPEDITVIPATITTIPTNAVLSATVRNLGRSDVPRATVAVYDGLVTPENKVTEQTAAFPGQAPVTLTFQIPVTDSKGHVFHVVVDPDNQLPIESDKNNNRALKPLMPELTYDFQVLASDITVTPNPADIGRDVKVTVKLSNNGTSDAYNVPIRLFIDQPGAPVEIATLSVDVPAGGSTAKETTWKASLAGSSLPLAVQIDPNGTFPETNKDNNSASVSLTVNASTLPNLTVSYRDMAITPGPVREGGNASISVLVKNDGYSAVENVRVSFYNGTTSNGGTLLGSRIIPSIAAGQSVQAATDWTGIAVSGGQLITVQVEPVDNSIQEITTDDNFTFLNLDILSLPDLAVSSSSIAINPATPKSGDPVAIAVTVQNGGEQEARDVIVEVREGGTIIGSTVISLVNGNSQATAILGYSNAGQTGTHQITVTVAPDAAPGNLIVERTKDNNSVVKTFSIQDSNLWLTEPYISPNGDGIKDSTDFSFRLAAPAKVSVQVIDRKGTAVRTFTGGELDNTAGTTVRWDGSSDAGVIVGDGTYQVRVVSQAHALLASLPVIVDNNRSPLADAIGTRYLLQNNMTCQIPDTVSEWNWLPHDSGIWFRDGSSNPGSPIGLYQMSPDGKDLLRVTPDDWSDGTYDYFVDEGTAALTADGTKIALAVWKFDRNTRDYIGSIWEQAVDGSGRRELAGGMELNIGKLKWSPDSKQIVFHYGPLLYQGYSAYELRMVHSEQGGMATVDAGSPYWNTDSVYWSPNSRSLAYSINTHCNADISYCHQEYETLKVADVNGATRVVHTSTNNVYSYPDMHWLADGMLLVEETPRDRNDRLLLVDTSNRTLPRVIQNRAEYPLYRPVYDIHPDQRSIALVSQLKSGAAIFRSLNIVGLDGSTVSVADMGYANGQAADSAAPVWSQAGDRLVYVERDLRPTENRINENLVVYDRSSGLSNKYTIAVSTPPTFNNYSGGGAALKVNRLIAWLSDKVSILVDTVDGYFAVNTEDGSKSSVLPFERGSYDPNVSVSPDQNYITYLQDARPSGACAKQWGQEVWTISSLMNLTADLRISNNKSVVKLSGIASDKNFAGYKLEYADMALPGTWYLVAPPSDVPAVNETLTDWVPPHEGSFLVRLTVWDLAGNQAVERKQLNWGVNSSITNINVSRSIFSPNNDGVNDSTDISYRVLDPVRLEFKVVDSKGITVRTFLKEHAEQVTSSVTWDGRDDHGRVVADGKYTLQVFDYVFPVEVDTTPPDVALVTILYSPAKFTMSGHAVDTNLKSWVIEYGEGANPSEWHEYVKGPDVLAATDDAGNPVLTPKIADRYIVDPYGGVDWRDLVWLTGKRFRISSTDSAGNTSSRMTGVMPEILVIKKYDEWVVSSDSSIDRKTMTPGMHKLSSFETIQSPLRDVRLQYRLKTLDLTRTPPIPAYSWIGTEAVLPGPSGNFVVQWDSAGLPANAVALRLIAVDESGLEYVSNEISIKEDDTIITNIPDTVCPILFDVDHGQGACGQISGKVAYSVQPPVDAQSCVTPELITINVSVVKPDNSEQLLKVYSAGQPDMQGNHVSDSLVTNDYPEGTYRLKADIDYRELGSGSVKKKILYADMYVDRVLPSGVITTPISGETVCPVSSYNGFSQFHDITVNGTISDNTYPASYRLEYLTGENTGQWQPAMTRAGAAVSGSGVKPITGQGPMNGRLGDWYVTGLLGKTVTTMLKVTDIAGNTQCAERTFSIRKSPELSAVTADRRLFSPVRDRLTINYTINDDLLVSVDVYDALTRRPVARIFADRHLGAGLQKFEWDGRDMSGALIQDGSYLIVVSARSSCGTFSSDSGIVVEIDTTEPVAILSYPLPNDPLPTGNIIEVKGDVSDLHFSSYKLEAGEGLSPSSWGTIGQGTRPVSGSKLAAWNTFGLKGTWTLRLSAEDAVGNTRMAMSTIDLGTRMDLIRSFSITPDVFSPNADQRRDTTHIAYDVTDACQIRVEVLNADGIALKTYTAATASAGTGGFEWDGTINVKDRAADGVYTVRIFAVLTGRPEVTQSEELGLTLDTAAPLVAIPVPADKAYYNKTELNVVGSITDQNPGTYILSLHGPAGTTLLETGSQNRSGYSFGSIPVLSEDTYTLTINASDQGENQARSIRAFTVDRTPPRLSLDSPKNGAFYGNSRNVIDINGSVVEKNLEQYSVRYGVGEAPSEWKNIVVGDAVPATTGLFSWKVGRDDGIADGVYTLSLYARDKAGLEGEAKVRLVVDNTSPEVSIAMPKDTNYITKPTDIKGTLVDANLDKGMLEMAEGGCAAAVKWGGIRTISTVVRDGVLDSWKTLPVDGEYCLRLSGVDKSGNRNETRAGLRIDTRPPSPPSLTGKTENKTANSLSWTRSVDTDTASYNVYRSGRKINAQPLADLLYIDSAASEGSYIYTVTAVDVAGNESAPSNAVTLRIDLTGPAQRISTPQDGASISGLVDVMGSAYSQDDFKEYRVYIGQGRDPSSWSLIRRSPLPISYGLLAQWDTVSSQDGTQCTLKLEGEDTSGNISVTQAVVTIDNTPPNQPLLRTVTGNGADVTLEWRAGPEPDLAGYLLYRNDSLANVKGVVSGSLKPYLVGTTTYVDTALPDGAYRYYLVAMDLAGNISAASNAMEIDIDTHPPHMTLVEPVAGIRFDAGLPVKAETPDNDITAVQFQYRWSQDAGWSNLGQQFVKPPFVTSFDPKVLDLSHGDYQLRALATDRHNNVDALPAVVTVTFADLTPPEVPAGGAARVNGADVKLTWDPVSEAGVSYNVYRTGSGARSVVNSAPIMNASYLDAGVADGTYRYEISAIDGAGNEGKASGPIPARIYTPAIIQPFTPQTNPVLNLEGNGVDPGSAVQVDSAGPSGESRSTAAVFDSAGSFRVEGITLAPGENRFTAIATDSSGNTSKRSETIVVVYDVPPLAPTGLAATVQGYDVQLSWDSGLESILGYNVYRDGVKLNLSEEVIGSQASASRQDNYARAQNAIDGDYGTYWGTPYGNGTFTPTWLEVALPEPELVGRVSIQWRLGNWDSIGNKYIVLGGRDYELQGWSGYNWITLKKVVGNDQQDNQLDISPSYRTDRLRIVISSTSDPGYSKCVRINEVKIEKETVVQPTSYADTGLWDKRFNYTVAAVDRYGFESALSAPVEAVVGDVVPPPAPTGLQAAVQVADVIIGWGTASAADSGLAGYRIYRQDGQEWAYRDEVPASTQSYTDAALPNGIYRYRITSFDQADNESDPSSVVSAAVAVAPPSIPPLLSVTASPEGRALMATWQASGGTAVAYNLYRSLTPGGGYLRVSPTPIQGLSYRDAGLTNGTTYYYVVTARDALGNESVYSSEATAVPRDLTAPERPGIFSPARPGEQLVVYSSGIGVSGLAEPGSSVALMRGGDQLGTVTALAEDVHTSRPFDVTGSVQGLSPDGSAIVYNTGNSELWLKDLSGGSLYRIAKNAWGGLWSPDGGKIAYSVYDSSWHQRVAIYDTAAATSTFVTDDSGVYEYSQSWSEDGSKIIFQSTRSGTYGIWLKNLTDNSLTSVADNVNVSRMSLSPDASRIAYFTYSKLYLIDIADRRVSLLDDMTDQASVAWTHDSSMVAFVSRRDGDTGLFVADLASQTTKRVPGFSGYGLRQPAWSPDSTRIVYNRYVDSGYSLQSISLDGDQAAFAGNLDSVENLGWSKDGTISFRDGRAAHALKLKGSFAIPMIQLDSGENKLYAVASDDSGNISQPSDFITVVFDTGRLPDLVINDSDITVYPPYPKPNEDAVVTARVHNPTGKPVDDFSVDLYLWDGSGALTRLTSEIIPHLDAGGEAAVSARFNAGTAIGTRTLIAAVDPDDLVAEVLNTNNHATKEIVVTDQERVTVSCVLNAVQYAANQDLYVSVKLRNSGLPKAGILTVVVEDGAGNPVKLLTSQVAELPYGADSTQAFTWNTSTTFSGAYRLHATVRDGSVVIAEDSTPFTITPDIRVSGGIVSDRQRYGARQDVDMAVSIKNAGVNCLIPRLRARVRVLGPQGAELFSGEQAAVGLMPGASASLSFSWNTGFIAPGAYTAVLDVFSGDTPAASSSTGFTVIPSVTIGGSIAADPAVVLTGNGFAANYSLTGNGNAGASGTAVVSLIDPDTLTVVATSENAIVIPMGVTVSGSAPFATAGLRLKNYLLRLSFLSQGNSTVIAATPFSVKDGTAPVLNVVSPREGEAYAKVLEISVNATDNASGVDKVEYRIDGGNWMPLPLADPALGTYSTVWTPHLDSYGPHTIAFRGSDRAANTGPPESVSCIIINDVDTTPPLLTAAPAGGIFNTTQSIKLTANEAAAIRFTTDGSIPTADSALYQAPIEVTATTTLRFLAVDTAGNQSDLITEVYTIDTTPPVLNISSLPDGSFTNNEVLNVSGTVTDNVGVKELMVNGSQVPFDSEGRFSQALLLKPGENHVNVAAADLATNPAGDNRTITLDQAVPLLTVNSPADNIKTNMPFIDVSGSVEDQGTAVVEVSLKGVPQAVTRDGRNFSATVALVPGSDVNTIDIKATDMAVNSISDKRSVYYDDKSPALAVTAPQQDLRTNQTNLTIHGTASDPYGFGVAITLEMSGQTFTPPLVDGRFEQAVTFTTEDTYTVVASATNEAGTSASVQRNIIYDVTPPALTIDPVTSPTTSDSQAVSGTRESGVDVTVSSATATVGTVTYPTATAWQISVSALKQGSNIITASSSDAAKNVATAFKEIVYTASTSIRDFSFAVFGNSRVTMSGDSYTDSYSNSPSCWIKGNNRNGDVGTNSLQSCGIQMSGGVQVFGRGWVGQGGDPASGVCMGGGSTVSGGSAALAVAKDMTPKTDPSGGTTLGAIALSGHKTRTLTPGDWRVSSISLSGGSTLTLNGPLTLHVDGNLSLSGNSSIVIVSGAVTIYQNGQKLDISGGSIVNTSKAPANLVIYGTAGLQTMNLSGGTDLHALVYAPTAAIKLSGGQNTFGSVIGNSVDISGGSSVHYDEALRN